MFKHIGALLASTMAASQGRIYGSANTARHIDRFGASAGYGRSRGKGAKPKKRSNMLHVSKRVRRKHRRAA